MKMYVVSKSDWKLFQEKIRGWQEAYMERLIEKIFIVVGMNTSKGKEASEIKCSEAFFKHRCPDFDTVVVV